jgi:catechol 2,3-dioxygenase-like lactoylglutathione lyase family enzyme
LCLLAVAAALLVSQPAFAQLTPLNEAGVTLGHMHFLVKDPEAHKKLWLDVFGAQAVPLGKSDMLKIPGMYILLTKAEPVLDAATPPTVDHIGLLVKDLAAVKEKLAAANVQVPERIPIATLPDGVRVELLEDKSLNVPVAFQHVHIFTSDAESIRAWYVKTFGAVASTRRGTMPTANFPAGENFPGGEVDFMAQPNAKRAPTKGRPIDHIGFEVKGLEAFCKKLEAEGVKFEIPFRDVPQIGLKIAFIEDPIGTRIELTEGLAGK